MQPQEPAKVAVATKCIECRSAEATACILSPKQACKRCVERNLRCTYPGRELDMNFEKLLRDQASCGDDDIGQFVENKVYTLYQAMNLSMLELADIIKAVGTRKTIWEALHPTPGPNTQPSAMQAKIAALEEKIASLSDSLVKSLWDARSSDSTSNSYSTVYKNSLESPDAQTNCDWLELCQVSGLSSVSAGYAFPAWEMCFKAVQDVAPKWPTRNQPEELFQPLLVAVLRTLLSLRSDSTLSLLQKPAMLGDAIPDAVLHLEGFPKQWASVCLPFELENGEESKKRHGQGQVISYLHHALGARRTQNDRAEGFAVFTNLYEVVVIYHQAQSDLAAGSLLFKHWATKELPLFAANFTALPTPPSHIPEGFIALLSLLQAPANLLASPLATLPAFLAQEKDNFPTLLSWRGGTQVWRARDQSSVMKIALTAERQQQLAKEFRIISALSKTAAPCPWRAEQVISDVALKLQPVGTRTLSGHACSSQEAKVIVRELLLQLQFCHAARVLHCDIRPSNVVLLADGSPCLIDWGCAVSMSDDAGARLSAVPGVPAWMSDGAVRHCWRLARSNAVFLYTVFDDLESLAFVYFALLGTPRRSVGSLTAFPDNCTSAPKWRYHSNSKAQDATKLNAWLSMRAECLKMHLYDSTSFMTVLKSRKAPIYADLLAKLQ